MSVHISEGSPTQSRSVLFWRNAEPCPVIGSFSSARAYYLSSAIETENLARAEATLQELLSSVDSSSDRVRYPLNFYSLTAFDMLIFFFSDESRTSTATMDAASSSKEAEGAGSGA